MMGGCFNRFAGALLAVVLLATSVSAQSVPETRRVALLAAWDTAWAADLGEAETRFGAWKSNFADTELQRAAELSVIEAIADLDGLVLDDCFRTLWATGRSAFVLRAESYAAVAKTDPSPIGVWQDMEAAIALLTGAQRLEQLVASERRLVDCLAPATPAAKPSGSPVP